LVLSLLQKLLQAGAFVYAENFDGQTACDAAYDNAHRDIGVGLEKQILFGRARSNVWLCCAGAVRATGCHNVCR
jgi:hypothetical protein